jgi:sec-independent protein translocase protein TatA
MVLSEIFGLDGVIVIVIVGAVILFGGAKQLPKLARSVGSAKGEFEKGLKEGADAEDDEPEAKKADPKALKPGNDTTASQTRRDETTA